MINEKMPHLLETMWGINETNSENYPYDAAKDL
jgi:hypothetical protein